MKKTLALLMLMITHAQSLPPYVVINDPNCPNKDVLTTPAETVEFPLTDKTKKFFKT